MLGLTLKADLVGVTDLRPNDSPDQPYHYTFQVRCTSCRETHPKWVGVSLHALHALPNSRGDAHFVWRCGSCRREASATLANPRPYAATKTANAPAARQKILEFDCRGCEFVAFKPEAGGDWICEGLDDGPEDADDDDPSERKKTGTTFDEVELGDEWYDYDDAGKRETSITNMEWEIRATA